MDFQETKITSGFEEQSSYHRRNRKRTEERRVILSETARLLTDSSNPINQRNLTIPKICDSDKGIVHAYH
jgi:hypothetical protein